MSTDTLTPSTTLRTPANLRAVCVFCGSRSGTNPAFHEGAFRLGEAIARRGLRLVFGGGHVGLMGAVADGALAAGGEVTGVIPHALVDRELAHGGVADMRITHSMHERKALMADLADGFIAMPGGYGTLDEFCEIITWAQLGIHQKPCALYDIAGFWAPLRAAFDHAVAEGFVDPEHRAFILEASDPDVLLDAMAAWEPTLVPKWVSPNER